MRTLLVVLILMFSTVAYADKDNGKVVYESMGCTFCHGHQGSGDGLMAAEMDPKPRDFTNIVKMSRISDATMFYNIRNGIPGSAMPAWGLTDTQIGDVIDYIRTFAYDHEVTKTLCVNESVTFDITGVGWDYSLDRQYIKLGLTDEGVQITPHPKDVREYFRSTNHKLLRTTSYLYDGTDLYLVVVRIRDCYK